MRLLVGRAQCRQLMRAVVVSLLRSRAGCSPTLARGNGPLIKSVSRSLVRLFIPAYLISIGFSFASMIIQYYVVGFLTWMVFSNVSARAIQKFDVNAVFVLACAPSLVDLWLLFHLNAFPGSLAVTGAVHGVAESLFWTAYHVNFLDASSSPSRGRVLSLIKILTKLGRALGPVTGGWLLHSSHTTTLLLMSSLFLIISILPNMYHLYQNGPAPRILSAARKKTDQPSGDVDTLELGEGELGGSKEMKIQVAADSICWTLDVGASSIYTLLGLVAHGIEKPYGNALWAYYCSVVFFETKMNTTGAYNSAILLVSLVVTYGLGNLVDSHRRNALSVAAIATGVLWLSRMLASESYQIAILDVCYNYTHSLLSIAFFASVYDHARDENQESFILKQQICISIGEMIGWILPLAFDSRGVSAVVFFAAAVAAVAQGLLVNNVNISL